MDFYGDVAVSAEIAGVELSAITEAIQQITNLQIDSLINPHGFNSIIELEEMHNVLDSSDKLILTYYPVVEITSIEVNANKENTYLLDNSEYILDNNSGIVSVKNYHGSRGFAAVKVKYRAGYSSVPNDIKLIANFLAAKNIENKNISNSGNIKSVKIGDYSESYDSEGKSIDSKYSQLDTLIQVARNKYGYVL